MIAVSKIVAGLVLTTALSLATTTYQLTQVDSQTLPVVVCTASGTTTSVTSGTLELAAKNKFKLTLNVDQTTGGTTTQQVITQNGTYAQKGNTITFKVPGAGTFTGTTSGGVLTVEGYPYCGATHSLTFQQT